MQRPFIALKWAESSDGFIDGIRNSTNKRPTLISAPLSRVITHRLRSVYDGILISGKTAALDLPSLTTRYYHGNHPVPIVLDSKEFPLSVEWLNSLSKKPIIVSERNYEGACQIQCDPSKINVWLPQLLSDFSICSILVEGGAAVLQSIIDQDVVDEMHILRSSIELGEGVRAPFVKDARTNSRTILFGSDVYERR
jgi:diaminohydroxyphosphoribosylaminopyrimidine deaminase/5-amino-6-(5-phosphoribosylamino)uracil reductase